MPSVFISAAHKSSGKTTLTIGLCAALKNTGSQVQAFKKGPDYIDPMWLGAASGNPCYNLDFFTMSQSQIRELYARKAARADITLVEGNKGLYDGLDLDGSNSNAALAAFLGIPVVLVLDARGMTRGIAPLVLGYQAFDPSINIAGVILNQVGGSRHESKLRAILQHYTDVPVLGAVHRHPSLNIDERHLGLVPSNESSSVNEKIRTIEQWVHQQIDIDLLRSIADEAPLLTPGDLAGEISPALTHNQDYSGIKIGIIKDAAFGFYYPDDIEAFAQQGAQILYINSMTDSALPDIDGLFIGGGFPETHLHPLSTNTALMADIRTKIESGLPTYAECGGLMYLARSIRWNNQQADMVGVIPGDISMHQKPQGRGYIKLNEKSNHPWPQPACATIHAHEFHYSSLDNLPPGLEYAFEVTRGTGIDGEHDGLIMYNLLANYAHFRNVGSNSWVRRFLLFIQQLKSKS